MKNKPGLRVIGLAMSVALTACGGSSGGDGPATPETPQTPEIADAPDAPEAPEVIDAPESPDTPEVIADDDTGVVVDPQSPELLAVGASRSGFVAQGESAIFRVPSDANISMFSTAGDADLILYSSEDFTIDTVLCNNGNYWQEENCTGSDPDGEIFAQVFGRTATSFSINVSNDCSVGAVNEWAYRNMQDYYLFADSVPVVDPLSYATTSELVRDVRLQSLDPFSDVSDAAARQAFFSEGRTFGFGFSLANDDDNNARIIRVSDDAPFGRAGIRRGDILVGINGELWTDIDNTRFFELVGDRDNPIPSTWQFIRGDTGAAEEFTLTASEYTINTVLHDFIYTHPDFTGSIGYLAFDGFLGISEAELDVAISRLAEGGVTELVLDLRYNGGGLISVANRLASQIGGPDLDGNLLAVYEFNDTYTAQNFPLIMSAATPTLDLDRVVVLTTDNTASSSELLINGLRPFMEVVLVGEATTGKPFISQPKEFCGIALSAMAAQGVNANGVSAAGSIAADCFAADDITRDFGGVGADVEGMLLSGLDHIVFGTCNAAPALAKRASSEVFHSDNMPRLGAVADPVRSR